MMDGKSYFDGEGLKITDAEFEEVKISNLSHRPNSVTAYGGKALSAKELKEKYDAPTKMLKDKFNGLIDEIVKMEGPYSAEQARRANEESRRDAEEKRQEFYGDLKECLELLEELQEKMLESVKETGSAMTSVLDAYPIGSVYISLSQTSPAILFGGAWERIKDRFLLGVGDTYEAESTGGSASHNHGSNNMWADIYAFSDTSSARQNGIIGLKHKAHTSTQVNFTYYIQDNKTLTRKSTEVTTGNTYGTSIGGNTDNESTLPPYQTVYMWKRIE